MKPRMPDHSGWRTMRGMIRGGESLTEALILERAAEKARDDAVSRIAQAPRTKEKAILEER